MAQEEWPQLSPELQAAQLRLLQLRMERGIRPETRADPAPEAARRPSEPNWLLVNAEAERLRRRQEAGLVATSLSLPRTPVESYPLLEEATPAMDSARLAPRTVLVQPTMLLAMLKKNLEAPGRVYLLLRIIDAHGRGWLDVGSVRQCLTGEDAPLRICGWRRLRQLLKQGEGIFWQRDGQDRLWLTGLHRTAYTLDSGRLQGFPIELPVETLLGGLQAVRAAFYGSFHGGRDSKPISRDTLRAVSGVAERTQRAYDHVAHIKRRRNIAIGERYTSDNAQERAWKQGRAVFHFVDIEGRQGRKDREYVAWHLPNSYQTAYQRRPRGSRKRLNRKLADLLMKGITGNDDQAIEKLFFPNGALAARQYTRYPEHDAYWQQARPTRAGDTLWHVITGIRE